ncbi:MAG: hypothetical protein IPM39_17475 [Chloroflexi bacterium]|nr:hypothetical protein [Chloroflexota bacterium]
MRGRTAVPPICQTHTMRTTSLTHAHHPTPPRWQFWILLALLAGIGLFWSLTLRQGHVWGGDFSLYIRHALNLLQGIPYGESGYILNPADPVVSPQAYPPVFPLLLLPALALFGFNLTALKMVVVVCFVLFLAVYAALLRRDLPFSHLCAVILVLGLNPFFWDFKDDVRSDIPFLLFTYIALVQIYHLAPEKRQGRQAILPAVTTGLVMYLAYGTRTLGIVLPACLLLLDLLQWRKITLFTLLAGIVFGLGVGGQSLFFPGNGYWQQYVFDPTTNALNVAGYLISLSTLWENGYSNALLLIVSIVTLSLAVTAVWTRLRARLTILELYLLAYVLVLAVWPVSQGIRFLIPVLPLYLFYVFAGVGQLAARLPGKWGGGLFWGVTAVIFLSSAARYTTLPFDAIPTGIGRAESVALFEYVRAETAETDVLIFRKPRVLALYTGRSSAIFHPEQSGEAEQWAFWREIAATHLIVANWDEAHWQQFIAEHQALLEPVYANADFRVYRLARWPEE